MASVIDRCIFNATSSGTGDFVVASAVTGYQTPSTAGAVNGLVYSYAAQSSDLTQWEVGYGTYASSSSTLARTTILFSSNSNAKVNFTVIPQVMITPVAEFLTTGNTNEVNIGNIVPLISDGLTDNSAAFAAFFGQGRNSGDAFGGAGYMKTAGALSFPTVVTFTLASPGVVNWTGHGLRVNETVYFSNSGGALPTGLSANTPYYVMYSNLTANSFQVSATNAIVNQTGDGTAVNFTGSQSGTQYAQTKATQWQEILLPPGPYHLATGMSVCGDQQLLRLKAYGVSSDNIQFGPGIGSFAAPSGGYDKYDWASAQINTVGVGATSVTLANTADASKFWVGGWICIGALDTQNNFGTLNSFPPNNHYNEFAQVTAINSGSGVLSLANPIRNGYNSGYPTFYWPVNEYISGTVTGSGGGAATIWPMSPNWDSTQEIYGLNNLVSGESTASIRKMKLIDCSFTGQGPVPSAQESFVAERCTFSSGLEIDKLVQEVRFHNCEWTSTNTGPNVQSSSVDQLIIDGCIIPILNGTARNTHIRDSQIQSVLVGPIGYGPADTLLIENCRIGSIAPAVPLFNLLGEGNLFSQIVNNYSFSNGTLSLPMVNVITANNWAIPGRKMYISDADNQFDSMGSPFTILDVYQTVSSSATVTISVANPAVVTWTSHGLTAGTVVYFTTTGLLPGNPGTPSGISAFTPYYVLSTGLTTNTFEVSLTSGGSAVSSLGQTQSGTHTAYSSPKFNIDTTLSSMPVGNSTNSTVTISDASPAVITWNSHGLTAGTPVCFTTTGSLPSGLSTTTMYYVISTGLTTNTFEISTSVGGGAVNTSSAGSGTQTAIANPLMFCTSQCARVTVRNCTGCPAIVDLSNSPPELPMWSYANRKYAGNPENPNAAFLHPFPLVRGTLVSLTIDVERAYTGSGTYDLNISCPAFNSSLIESDLSATINCNTAGTRIITPSGATGSQTGDTIAAFGNWLSGGSNGVNGFEMTISGTTGSPTLENMPIVNITISTDQGELVSSVVQVGSGNDSSGQLADTTVFHGY